MNYRKIGRQLKTTDETICLNCCHEEETSLSPNSTVEILGIFPTPKYVSGEAVCVRIIETDNEELIDDIYTLCSSLIEWEE